MMMVNVLREGSALVRSQTAWRVGGTFEESNVVSFKSAASLLILHETVVKRRGSVDLGKKYLPDRL